MHLFLSTCLYSFHNSVYPCDLRQMDTEQLPNHWEHSSHILDIGKTHSVRRDPSERNCNSRRLQRREPIKSISFRPFYSQKGDWHPSGMAPVHYVPILWLLSFPTACPLAAVVWELHKLLPTTGGSVSSALCHDSEGTCGRYLSVLNGSHTLSLQLSPSGKALREAGIHLPFDRWGSRDLKNTWATPRVTAKRLSSCFLTFSLGAASCELWGASGTAALHWGSQTCKPLLWLDF